MKILIADDDPICQAGLRLTLLKFGHEVVAVDTGEKAWNAVLADYYPVVITDFQMPDRDGMSLTRLIRARPQEEYTYILMLSALSTRDNYLDAVVAGVDDFLGKPLDAALIAARLHVAQRIIGLQNHVRRLESIMSVCSYCKKVRDGERWVEMQEYVAQEFGTMPSHGICPHCFTHRVKPEMEAFGIKMD
jgi:sigma-B regulation protein RsbU (phosphoserine phosphatase)